MSDILTGRNKRPSAHVLQQIATTLSCPVDYFTRCGIDDGASRSVVPLVLEPNIEVIGVAETGAFRSKDRGAVRRSIYAPKHPRYPDAKHFALEVQDTSMDISKPFPMAYRSHALCIDIEDAGLQVEPHCIYGIERKNGRDMVELLIRRAVPDAGNRFILRAESSEPQSYPDIPAKRLAADDSELRVIGLVYAVISFFNY